MTLSSSAALKLSALAMSVLALAGCSRQGEIDSTGGIVTVRSSCPVAAVPAMTGDITLFNPSGSTDASAIDVVAEVTNVRSTCQDAGEDFYTEATFDVHASRRDASGARQVTLPYFSTVVRGGSNVVAKRVGQVTLNFAAGEYRASTSAKASSYVNRAAASLPADLLEKIRGKRKAGDIDAATDPLSTPEARAALQSTSFELLVGFNLTPDQFRYNATR